MLNQFCCVGRMVGDPKFFDDHVCFVLAVDDDFAREGDRAKTNYFDFIAWGSLAGRINNRLKNGDLVSVVSSAHVRSYETKGEKRRKIEFKVEHIERLRRAETEENTEDLCE